MFKIRKLEILSPLSTFALMPQAHNCVQISIRLPGGSRRKAGGSEDSVAQGGLQPDGIERTLSRESNCVPSPVTSKFLQWESPLLNEEESGAT